ncbi:hypothetical protein CF328_g6648, partial [Tilletia controversa]
TVPFRMAFVAARIEWTPPSTNSSKNNTTLSSSATPNSAGVIRIKEISSSESVSRSLDSKEGGTVSLHPAVDYHQSSPLSDTLRSRLSFDSPSDQSVDFAATGTAQPQEEDSTFAGSPCHIPSPSSTLIPQYRQDYPHLEASSPYPSKLQVVDLEAKLHQQSSDFAQLQHRYRQLSRSFNESLSREAVLERFVVRERLRLSPEPPLPSSGTDITNASSSCIVALPFSTLTPTLKTPATSKSRLSDRTVCDVSTL